MTTLFAVQNPDVFRENVRKKMEPILDDETNATNLEKAIFNYAIKEATSRKFIK